MLTLRSKVLKRLDTYRADFKELPIGTSVDGYWLQQMYCSLGVVSCGHEVFDEPLTAFFGLQYQMWVLRGVLSGDQTHVEAHWKDLSSSIRDSKHRSSCECLGPFRRGTTHHSSCGYTWPFLPISKERHRGVWEGGKRNVTSGEGHRWDGSPLKTADAEYPSADADYFLQPSDDWQHLTLLTRSPTRWTLLERFSAD